MLELCIELLKKKISHLSIKVQLILNLNLDSEFSLI